jgi:hypothetical protein
MESAEKCVADAKDQSYRNWANHDTYEAVMDIVKDHRGAYCVGVEYACTMVHTAMEQRWMNP